MEALGMKVHEGEGDSHTLRSPMRFFNHWSVWVLLALLMARFALGWIAFRYPDRPILIDSEGYLRLAESLRTLGQFRATESLETVRTPGYPAFLAVLQAVSGQSIGFVVLVQFGLTLLTAVLIYLCAFRLGGAQPAIASVWIYALNPNSLFWAFTLLTETLFAFGLTLSLYLFLLAVGDSRLRWLLGSGLVLGLSTLVRPIGIYLIPLWALASFLILRRRIPLRQAARSSLLLFVIAALPVVSWMARNQLRHGIFSLSTTTSVTITRFIAVNTLADALGVDREAAKGIILSEPDPMAYSLSIFRKYPGSLFRATVQGILRTMLGTEVGTWLGTLFELPYDGSGLLGALVRGDLRAAVSALSQRLEGSQGYLPLLLLLWGMGYSVLLYALLLYGAWRSLARFGLEQRLLLALFLVTIGYLLLVPLANGDARFRVPPAPLMAVVAGMTWLHSGPKEARAE